MMRSKALLVAALVAGLSTTALADPFSFTATDTPLAIPPSGTSGTTTSTITVGTSGIISDLNVFVNLTHTFTGDLEIFLTHVDTGTSVQLFDQHGGGGNNITDVTFDDEAGTAISAGTPPFGPGSFMPFASLTAFDGENVFGTWTLRIDDLIGGDSGTLQSFSILGAFTPTPIPEPGTYALFGLGALGLAGLVRRRRKAAATPAQDSTS